MYILVGDPTEHTPRHTRTCTSTTANNESYTVGTTILVHTPPPTRVHINLTLRPPTLNLTTAAVHITRVHYNSVEQNTSIRRAWPNMHGPARMRRCGCICLCTRATPCRTSCFKRIRSSWGIGEGVRTDSFSYLNLGVRTVGVQLDVWKPIELGRDLYTPFQSRIRANTEQTVPVFVLFS